LKNGNFEMKSESDGRMDNGIDGGKDIASFKI
jgi:hypothetical protein